MSKRKRITRKVKVLVATSASIFIGAHGFFAQFEPGDRLYDGNKKEHLEWTNESLANEIDLEISRSLIDNLQVEYPGLNRIQLSKKYKAASTYLRVLQRIKMKKTLIS